MSSPVEVLAAVRDLHPEMLQIGMHGKCFRIYLLLKAIFPQAKPFWNMNHVITEIDGEYWDIRGRVIADADYMPMLLHPGNHNNAYLWDTKVEPLKK